MREILLDTESESAPRLSSADQRGADSQIEVTKKAGF
jgi:hypothetical protein